ncbi:YIP1 family protein [Clostridium pasteurianum]|uniref:YIP1 family protein n=1 Tax=Clostridium pasteurianum TaxID=1501 RepID=UPI0022609FC8|nr:YIP1 family protein [Clostridium pasteurianum]UZW14755.1 YIP1 family protein [Clostridium pasteurianum]
MKYKSLLKKEINNNLIIEYFKKYEMKEKYKIKFLIIAIVMIFTNIINFFILKDNISRLLNYDILIQKILSSPIMLFIISIFTTLNVYISIAILSFIYMLLIKTFKGKIKFKQMISIYSLSYMPILAKIIINDINSFVIKKPIINISKSYIDIINQYLNVFTIIQIIILIFGISIISKISKKKSIIIVAIVLSIGMLINIGIFLVQQNLMN